MLPKQLLQDYLTFSKKDRIGAILFVLTISSFIFLPRLLAPSTQPLTIQQANALERALDTLQERKEKRPAYKRNVYTVSYPSKRSAPPTFIEAELFLFDPNTMTEDGWQRLGLNARTSQTIINYINKGGKFYKPEDLQKIWGMPKGFYERVKSFVRIVSVKKENSPYSNNKPTFSREERMAVVVSINEADSNAFIALPGIGSKLSARILAFREKLGGFYSVEQIAETYGLPDSTFEKIKSRLQVDKNGIRKLNLNAASKEELKSHPYIRWNLANAIVEYRSQHGTFKQVEDLKRIVLIDDATYKKISPYLSLD